MKKLSMMLIALLAALTMSANRFTKVTEAPTDWSGQYLLTYMSSDTVAYVFSCVDGSSDYISVQVPSNGIIESDKLDDYAIEFASMEGGYSLKYIPGGTYMSCKKDTNSLVFSATKQVNEITFYKADSVDITCKGMYFVFNSTKNQTRFRYFKASTAITGKSANLYKHITLYKSENKIGPVVWTPDTISVDSARQLVDEKSTLMSRSHYIKGIVKTVETEKVASDGYANIWLVDIDNPALELQGYKIYKDSAKTVWSSASEIPCAQGDTVMLFGETLTLYKSTTYETTPGYFVELLGKAAPWTPDTITVAEACQLIDSQSPLMNKSHYIKGVVRDNNFGSTWPGYAMVWMKDMEDPEIQLEGFKIYKNANRDKWDSMDDIPFRVADTIMVYADGLSKFGTVYETTSGYFVEVWEANFVEATSVFQYPYNAVYLDSVDGKYRYDIALSRENGVYDNALHYIIRSANEKGITGKYDTSLDSSYVDGEGKVVDGSITIKYISKAATGTNINYLFNGNFSVGGILYSFTDDTIALSGIDDIEEGDPYRLVDDVPFIPNEGDTLTCAEALKYAQTLGSETSTINVYIRGFVITAPQISTKTKYTRSFYMNDDSTSTVKVAQSYWCYEQNNDSICQGDEVLIYGNILLFNNVAEIKEGKIYRLNEGPKYPTAIEEVAEAAKQVNSLKIVKDGVLYIIKNGVVYNAQGNRLQ